ncbi:MULTISPECIES: beta/gamma crystallin domain-containing protein [unclassified Kitasatospora]|uniref:beta/gamma crystallin domain-containing protein n=1 Tax=unclassified Kitasatospora TaxID=2633591 RepID=UPI002E30F475|nr:beta/gamma crystallin domain-containing protein [Kitasatospora sp. NBC_01246]
MIRRTNPANPRRDRRTGNVLARRIGALAVLTAAAAALLPTTGANAVSQVECGNRTDFAKVYNYGYSGRLCFANDGWMSVRVYNVDRIDAGNNRVITYLGGGLGSWTVFNWEQYDFNGNQGHQVTMYDINLSRW